MKRITFFVLALIGISSFSAQSQTTWKLDKSHSTAKFTATHLLISEVEGSFKSFDGSFTSSKPDFTDAKIEFTIDVASINTDNEMRDGHLKSDDFFNAEKFPKAIFKGVMFQKTGDKTYKLVGNLTIRDVTRSVTWEVTYGGTTADGYGNTKAGFKAKATINRFDFNLKWNSVTEAGTAVVDKNIDIVLNLQFAAAK